MVKLIEIMLKENLITKDAISTLVKSRPPKKISFANGPKKLTLLFLKRVTCKYFSNNFLAAALNDKIRP